jgi:hypothetical protein
MVKSLKASLTSCSSIDIINIDSTYTDLRRDTFVTPTEFVRCSSETNPIWISLTVKLLPHIFRIHGRNFGTCICIDKFN